MPGSLGCRASRSGRRPLPQALAPRAGTATVELLFNLPIWLILILALAHVGRVLSDAQQMALASREGAREASRSRHLPVAGEVPGNVIEAVERQLHHSAVGGSLVILEHNREGARATLASGTGWGVPPNTPLPKLGRYVRVTIFAQGKAQSTTFRDAMVRGDR